MKRLSSPGFAHHILIMAILVVAVIGGIGSYIYLKSSSAATNYAAVCGSRYQLGSKTAWKNDGQLRMYFRSSGKRVNDLCFLLVSRNSAYGTTKYMEVKLGRKANKGNFKYYAGPIYRPGSDRIVGSSGTAKAVMRYKSQTTHYSLSFGGVGTTQRLTNPFAIIHFTR